MSTGDETRTGVPPEALRPPAPGAAPDAPAERPALARPLRRVLLAWAGIVLVELGMWLALWKSNYLRPLWAVPAVAILVAGVAWTVHIAWRRVPDRRDEAHDRRSRRKRRAR